jgi:hypothetical protein
MRPLAPVWRPCWQVLRGLWTKWTSRDERDDGHAAEPAACPERIPAVHLQPDVESACLGPFFLKLRHERHGCFIVTRRSKAPGEDRVRFNLTLVAPGADPLDAFHCAVLATSDARCDEASTLRLAGLVLPEPMRGKGACAAYAAAAALAAREVGARRVVIEAGGDERMGSLCRALGMDGPDRHGQYVIDAHAMYRNAMDRCIDKGWK